MAILTYTPPYPDQANQATITPLIWNGMFDGITNYLNSIITPAINTLQATATGAGSQGLFQARLTNITGVPIPSDPAITTISLPYMTGPQATNVFLTPYGGNGIGLYNTSSSTWIPAYLTSDAVLNLASNPTPNGLLDIYVGVVASVITLSAVPYPTQVTNGTAGSGVNAAIPVASTANFATGDVIFISNSAGTEGETCVVQSITTNVNITVALLSNFSYVSGSIISCARPTIAQASQDSIPVLSTDKSKRYCGTIMLYAGVLLDAPTFRHVANYYNRVPRTHSGYLAQSVACAPATNNLMIGPKTTNSATFLNWSSIITPYNTVVEFNNVAFQCDVAAAPASNLSVVVGLDAFYVGPTSTYGAALNYLIAGTGTFVPGVTSCFTTNLPGRHMMFPWYAGGSVGFTALGANAASAFGNTFVVVQTSWSATVFN